VLTVGATALPGADLPHRAAALGRRKVARVVVPAGPHPATGLPVCYLLHSFAGDRRSWLRALGPAVGEPPLSRWVLVAPESGRRWFINDHGGRRYEDYLLDDLVPAVEASLGAPVDASRQVIGGFSMGGAAAVALALRHPRRFPRAFAYAGAFYANRRQGDPYRHLRDGACLMPTEAEHDRVWGPPGSPVRERHDPDRLIAAATAVGRWPRIALEVGLDDYPRVIEVNRQMHRALDEAGIAHHYREAGGDHGWPPAAAAARRLLARWSTPSAAAASPPPPPGCPG
jgi:S-formylglutathione hydrolase FrmB